VASFNVIEACFIHSRGSLSRNSSAKIPELTTSWCSISRTVRTNAFVDLGGLLLQEVINLSRSSLHTPAVRYIVSWPSSTLTWIDSHLIARCFLFLLVPVLHTVFKCASWAIFSVATIAASQWTNWCLRCCSVSTGGVLLKAPVVRLDSAPSAPGWSVSGAMACCCGNVRKMITKRSGKCWRLYRELQVKMEWVTVNLHLQFKLSPAGYSCTTDSCRGFQLSGDLQYVGRMFFVHLQGYIEMNQSWYLMFDRYKKDILRRKRHLVMFVSRHRRDLTWITPYPSRHDLLLAWLFRMKWRSKRWFCFVPIDQTYQPWHRRRSLPPCGPVLATFNISPHNKVNRRYNG